MPNYRDCQPLNPHKQDISVHEEIKDIVEQGYNQAAFSKKQNANKFIKEWKKRGKKKVKIYRTGGPTIEEPNIHIPKSYYVIME